MIFNMKPMKLVSLLLLIMNLLFVFNVYANDNIFEVIAPSSYKPANLLKEFELIDSGRYRLNLNQDINSLFPQQKITQAILYLVMPNASAIIESSVNFETQHRTDFSYYVFKPVLDEANATFDVSMELKTASVSAKEFGFVVIARNDQGETLVHNSHDNNMYKDIIMQEYFSGLRNNLSKEVPESK